MQGIDAVIEEIREREEARAAEAERLRSETGSTLFANGGCAEETFLREVAADSLDDVTVTGVDGGVVRKEFQGVDVFLLRAVAATFSYTDGALDDCTYRPDKNPSPEITHVSRNLQRSDVNRLKQLERLHGEIEQARAAVDDSDVLLLDGALVPQWPDRPAEGTALWAQYRELVDAYRELYDAAQRQDVLLAGIVEDTRSSQLCAVLQENGFDSDVVQSCQDSTLLSYLLEKGERTLLMAYGDVEQHPILRDIGERGADIYTCYLKTVKHDRPVRLDVYAPGDVSGTADRLASVVYALSGVGNSYGLPVPLIEADQRAKLSPHDVELFTKRLQSKIGHLPGVNELRRDRRPF